MLATKYDIEKISAFGGLIQDGVSSTDLADSHQNDKGVQKEWGKKG